MTLLDFIERRLQFGNHRGRHGVAFVRAVQRDRRDLSGDVQDERGIHNSNLLSIHEWSMSVFCANLIGHFERFG